MSNSPSPELPNFPSYPIAFYIVGKASQLDVPQCKIHNSIRRLASFSIIMPWLTNDEPAGQHAHGPEIR